jgi:putative ATPase
LASSVKSNRVYEAVLKAKKQINETGNLPVPLILRNAETNFMKDIGYGANYKYAHDFENAEVNQQHFPDDLEKIKPVYYTPTDRGYEKEIRKKIEGNKNS